MARRRGVLQVTLRLEGATKKLLKKIRKKYQQACDEAYGQGNVKVILVAIGHQDTLDSRIMWQE